MSEVERYKPYKGAAAGWGALIAVTKNWLGSENAFKNIRTMLKTNQNGGFDCPGCAWGESPENGMVKFCENGAKAVNWEATGRLVNPAFFNKYTVSALAAQSDYWLEYQGRLTHPMRYDASLDRYVETSWDDAFALIAKHLNALESPDQAEFYTSGRASNEAAYLYQLFVRAYGTNNFPDCSNMCHEASGLGMDDSVGVGKGTVTFDDLEEADAIFVIGQNPGTNHPRMLEPLREAVKRGAQVICFNPLKERGLERFQHPQHPLEMLTNGSEPTSSAYFRPALGGDMAAMRGIAKFLWQWEREALANNGEAVFDRAFIAEHTSGLDAYLAEVDATSWEHILEQSGLSLEDIELAARMYRKAKRVIMCWAMGVTQHTHSVLTVQEVVNVQLLRGNIGRPGAGLSPVRGHSNVQGDRTMGINELAPAELLDALEARFAFKAPRKHGHNTVMAIAAMEEGRAKVFIGLGGNFAQATPDSPRTHAALRNCELTVHIATKLNRSHLVTGREALILPCLGRTDIDLQAQGPQGVTVEDTFSMVHISHGQLKPKSPLMRSEPAIIAGIANATLGSHPIDWLWVIEDYSRIRNLIADTIPGFKDFNQKLLHPGGFHLGNDAAQRIWKTATGKAQFTPGVLPEHLVSKGVRDLGVKPELILQTMRSHDQYNTTLYGLDDRYRGVYGMRDVVFVNEQDIRQLGYEPGQKVDMISLWGDGRERRVSGFTLIAYDIPPGQAAAYYPETNPLVPLESYGDRTFTPTSKFIAIRLEPAPASNLIQSSVD
ncbi:MULTISPECIES: FdhF/YdeP family oxidoreductase [Pseudomonas]|uniref:Oxidoreductase alpha (Molybdopterin) subunit n=1 Tax=Pseudomonas chlororaphis O6 TaxID=1037915 RepID=A0AB33WZJ7_9PSED|nr:MULTISPECIES: FdhF/YdeP family oxidoreductase [Pseudomonas]AZD87126.1 Putative formate dehydrogenase oxidoreductase protein [Pseudomonas chlororaphis subsp. aureofaciens]AZE05972.1 Putative formate dehydrogenase oxidoreductase protein [Pseudomonas chlororaphis subsp. aureofaciens]EIM18282.1 oxidoreductase alpha (molybdopterin) subunit [Pseudomonas chlororaphis O6]MBP5065962.1 FdhF/YdeP family oxidoreductase [Pseudomonas chlororaphis]POA65463.1 CbbBc protein [Pseudomonas sp. GW531-T4]